MRKASNQIVPLMHASRQMLAVHVAVIRERVTMDFNTDLVQIVLVESGRNSSGTNGPDGTSQEEGILKTVATEAVEGSCG